MGSYCCKNYHGSQAYYPPVSTLMLACELSSNLVFAISTLSLVKDYTTIVYVIIFLTIVGKKSKC